MAELENTQNTEAENQAAESEENKAGKFYTPEEIAMIEQKAGDKRINQYQKTLEKRNREAEKLNKMSDDERYAYELEQREKAIEEFDLLWNDRYQDTVVIEIPDVIKDKIVSYNQGKLILNFETLSFFCFVIIISFGILSCNKMLTASISGFKTNL